MNRRTSGFTLVELLIALLIVSLILSAVVSVYVGTTRSAASLQARNDLQPELQVTQNYMASKLRQASYIFYNGANVQMSVNGKTTAKPDGTQNWVVGDTTAPIVAFIIPPKTVATGACATATTTTASTYCYAFYAFYPMKRNAYLAAVSGAEKFDANPVDDSTAWVMMEYRAYYSAFASNPIYGLTGFGIASPNEIPKGGQGRLLMDYLAPTAAATPLFTQANTPANPTAQTAGSTTVTMNLAALQTVAGQPVRVPAGTTTTYSTLTVYPRNVGKTQLSN
ncbi:type II secretion system protein J [Deinococcus altitudinis]|uniref:PulJ/GspJ family protein n=1 Tax=Deinococcus altitudinis TaxID=468914 RepID=UPI0038927CF2